MAIIRVYLGGQFNGAKLLVLLDDSIPCPRQKMSPFGHLVPGVMLSAALVAGSICEDSGRRREAGQHPHCI